MKLAPLAGILFAVLTVNTANVRAEPRDYTEMFFSEAPSDGGLNVKGSSYFYLEYGQGWKKGGAVRWITDNVVEISEQNNTKSYYCRSTITSRVGYCTARGWSQMP